MKNSATGYKALITVASMYYIMGNARATYDSGVGYNHVRENNIISQRATSEAETPVNSGPLVWEEPPASPIASSIIESRAWEGIEALKTDGVRNGLSK